MLLIPLRSCVEVLGVQWLDTLGVVKHAFKNLKIEFSYQGRVHTIWSMKQEVKLVIKGQLNKVVPQSAQMCMLQLCTVATTHLGFDLIQRNRSET